MKNVDIDLGVRGYQVRIGSGLLADPKELTPYIAGNQACVVSDDLVAPLYLAKLKSALAEKQVLEHIIPHGESSKTLATVAQIFDALLASRCDRSVTIIALGGGVVGDIAGFAAACYQRGVAFLQIPTTLLAQVDSSVGGKTGVNHPAGKNMIGAFHQPCRVLADTNTLASLAAREFSAGLAEVIKYGVIADSEFFAWLEKNMPAVMARQPRCIVHSIARSCQIKAQIVQQDELESGVRALLNLGHTFGHAIETGSGYGTWLHGEAVATGMCMAATLSCKMGWLSQAESDRITALLRAAQLPVTPFAGLDPAQMLRVMQVDKKARGGQLRLVLPTRIGEAVVTGDYPPDALRQTLVQFAHG